MFKTIILTLLLISILSIAAPCSEATIIDLTPDNYEAEVLESKVPVVIDFWASWCKPCKAMSSIIERLAMFHGNKVKFVKVNVDKNTKFLANFRPLRGLPLLIFYKNGKEVDRILGLTPFTTVNSKILLMLKEERKEKKEKKDKKKDDCEGGTCEPPEGY